jgi:tetratricopeptide (TPR) repeat protein
MSCVSDTTILAYFRGELDRDATGVVEHELDRCLDCRELMLLVAAEWRHNDGALGDELRSGTTIGRYVIEDKLGAGAMGVVYRAKDPALGRELALKVMAHPSPVLAERLRHEAQAMARLAHKNVVPVFDVGADGNQTYVAMGLVRGVTLREWLAGRRTRTEILECFAQAADGLAAAHDAGIVHRDFKPDNVLVAGDGSVQVGDFGLALAAGDHAAVEGTPAGTPAYLAPEVRTSGKAGAAADQYGFFVALHEAVTGARPAGGAVELRPRRLARAITRGLADDPARRFASMHVVARELRALQGTRRRIALLAAALAGAAGIVVATLIVTRDAPACATAGDELDSLWSASRASELRAAFGRVDKPYAAAAAESAIAALDRYAEAWRASAIAACRATHVDELQSPDMLDRRTACLAGRRSELAAVIDRFLTADAEVAARAIAMVDGLTPTMMCDDVAVLKDAPVPPRDLATAQMLAEVRELIAQVKAHIRAGTFARGEAIARKAATAARATGYRPAIAEALAALGNITMSVGKPEDALPILDEALLAAEASRHAYSTIAIRIVQAELLGVTLGRYDEARRIAVLGRATAEGVGVPALAAELDMQIGIIDSDRGKHAEALAMYERALPVFRKAHGDHAADTGHLIGLIGITLDDLGRHGEAIAMLEQALAITERVYGPAHPHVANAMSNLGSHLYRGGDQAARARALELTRKAHAIRVAALAPDHKELAMSWSNVGALLRVTGDLAGAREHVAKALAIKQRTLGEQHPSTAISHLSLAEVMLGMTDTAGSLEHAQRAVAIFAKALGETHLYTATARAHLGVTLTQLERHDDAIATFELAIPHLEGSPDRHRHLLNLAQLLADTRRDPRRIRALTDEALAAATAAKDQIAIDAIARFRRKL